MQRIIIRFFLILILLHTHLFSESFFLTESEKEWLNSFSTLNVGITEDWPPFSYEDDYGNPRGIDVEIINLLNVHLAGRLRIQVLPWTELSEKHEENQIDVVMSIRPTKARYEKFLFTDAYTMIPYAIVAKKTGPNYLNIERLNSKTVALEKGYFMESYVREHYPDINIKTYENTESALNAVSRSECDFYIGNQVVSEFLIEDLLFNDLDIHSIIPEIMSTNSIAVSKEHRLLVPILNRLLNGISHSDKQKAFNHWKSENLKKQLFTIEELAWIQSHPYIRVGAEKDWPPFDFVEYGSPTGYSNDYIRLLADKAGFKLDFIHGFSWETLMDMLKEHQVDLLPAASITTQRKQFAVFSDPYYENKTGIFVHKENHDIKKISDLNHKTVGIIAGFSTNELILVEAPEAQFKYFNSVMDALIAVDNNECDAYLDYTSIGNYIIKKNMLSNTILRAIVTSFDTDVDSLHLMINKDDYLLKSILDKARTLISPSEMFELYNRWLSQEIKSDESQTLRNSEIEWLKSLDPIRVGVGVEWPPFIFDLDHDEVSGIYTEYLRILEEQLGLSFELVPFEWSNLLNELDSGSIDLLPGLDQTEERRKYLTYCDPFIRVHNVIITKNNTPFISNLGSLKGKKVGMRDGSAVYQSIAQDFPDLEIETYRTMKDAMKALHSGDVHALVMNSVVFDFLKTRLHYDAAFKINNTTPYVSELSVALRKDLAVLQPYINRVFNNISTEEHHLIMEKWTKVEILESIDWSILIFIIIISSFIIIVILIWNKKLNSEVQKRKSSELRFRNIVDSMADWIWEIDKHGNFMYCSENVKKIMGYSHEEILNKNIYDFSIPGQEEPFRNIILSSLKNKKVAKNIETWVLSKKGEYICLITNTVAVYDDQDKLISYRGISSNITSRKINEEILEFGFSISKEIGNLEIEILYEKCVKQAMNITNSYFGFLAFVNKDQNDFNLVNLSGEGIRSNTVDSYLYTEELTALKSKGLECIQTQDVFIENDYDFDDSDDQKLFDEHISIKRILMIPVVDKGSVVAIMGVVNKYTDYSYQDIHFVDILSRHIWSIVERKQSENLLKDQEEQYRSLFNDSSDAILILNSDSRLIEANPATLDMFMYDSLDEFKSLTISDLSPEFQPDNTTSKEGAKKSISIALNLGMNEFEWLHKRSNGDRFYANVRLTSMYVLGEKIIQATIRDITLQKKVEEELKNLTHVDGLTNISNRRHFDEVFQNEWSRAIRDKQETALIMCDIDFFKNYNDNYGHQGGDAALIQVAQQLNKVATRPTDLAARYGGEEFAIILPNTDMQGAMIIAEKLRQSIEALGIEHNSSDAADVLTISIGVAVERAHINSEYESLIKSADKALYEAKSHGRNCVYSSLERNDK